MDPDGAVTHPCRLPYPKELDGTLSGTRRARVEEHWIRVNDTWWNRALLDRGLPGGPMKVTYDERRRPGISRGGLFELANDGSSDWGLRLLLHTLAWGGGTRARLMNKRLDTLAVDTSRAASVLSDAAEAAGTSPADAYGMLYPSRRALLKYIGPAFFTKFLYFAGGGDPRHPCLILDRVTATALRSLGWRQLRSSGWSSLTYAHYCELLACWAYDSGGRIKRVVAADEIERWLFDRE